MSESNNQKLYVLSGPLAGGEFQVTVAGIRLGRSSSCEISIPDPALSRNNSLFEVRDGDVWVTDLASANGTLVNGSEIGANSLKLSPGDIVEVGETRLSVGPPAIAPKPVIQQDSQNPRQNEQNQNAARPADSVNSAQDSVNPVKLDAPVAVDLGLGHGKGASPGGADGAADAPPDPALAKKRLVLWGIAGVLLVLAVAAWFAVPDIAAADAAAPAKAEKQNDVLLLEYEKVEATATGIHRYRLDYRAATGELHAKIDEVGAVRRSADEKKKLDKPAAATLAEILARPDFRKLEPEYTGIAAKPNTLSLVRFKVVDGEGVFETACADTPPPEAMADARARLESFAQNELSLTAMQYSQEKLIELSRESEAAADEKFAERDISHGNLAAALAAYRKAIAELRTVEPKPDGYAALIDKERVAARELDRRVKDLDFRCERALNLQDWPLAKEELEVLAQTLDPNDERLRDVRGKIMDVERRLADAKRSGSRKGKGSK